MKKVNSVHGFNMNNSKACNSTLRESSFHHVMYKSMFYGKSYIKFVRLYMHSRITIQLMNHSGRTPALELKTEAESDILDINDLYLKIKSLDHITLNIRVV